MRAHFAPISRWPNDANGTFLVIRVRVAATTIFGIYTAVTGDASPAVLVHFYQRYRACVRAKIAIRHLADAAPREPAKWPAQARAYPTLAREHLQRCAAAELAPGQPPCSSTIEPPL